MCVCVCVCVCACVRVESEDEIAARKAKTALEKQRNVPQGTFCRVIEHVLPKREPLKHRR